MSLSSCVLTWQAFLACTSHAFSTSKAEILGLLLGSWDDTADSLTVTVEHVMVLTRTDKQPDRCEVSPLQLAAASTAAENMSKRLGKEVRVCGWYHSHPAITVFPSHVDVKTQTQYQQLDPGFVGLIFAVFQQDGHKVGKIEVTAFQSGTGGVSPPAGAPYTNSHQHSTADASKQPSAPSQGAGKSIPLWIQSAQGGSTVPLSDALHVLCGLQNTLFQEERTAYLTALQQHGGLVGEAGAATGHEDLLEQLYCSAVYSKSLVSLLGESMLPLLQTLKAHASNLQTQAETLQDHNRSLRAGLTQEQEESIQRSLRELEQRAAAAPDIQ